MGARLLVHESIFDKVVEKFVEKAKCIRIGDPMDPNTQMGTVISATQLQRVKDFVHTAKKEGASILCGGKVPDGLPQEVQNVGLHINRGTI